MRVYADEGSDGLPLAWIEQTRELATRGEPRGTTGRSKGLRLPVMADPQPTQEAVNVASVQRRVWCIAYEACLGWAIAHDWAGFHCQACPVRAERIPVSPTRRRGMLPND